MSSIIISNVKDKNLEPIDYYRNPQFKSFSVSSSLMALMPFYKELLRQILDNKIDENFQDLALTKVQTKKIIKVFSKKIDETIPKMEKQKPYNIRIEWKEKLYEMRVHPFYPNNMMFYYYYKIYTIAKECFDENKPLYLSVNNDE